MAAPKLFRHLGIAIVVIFPSEVMIVEQTKFHSKHSSAF